MIAMFNYNRSDDELFNSVVDAAVESTRISLNGVENRAQYEADQKLINEQIVKYAVQGTRYESAFEKDGAAIMKNPMVVKACRANFDAVIAEIINAAIPMTTSKRFGDTFMEIHQVGWGDTARFLISSNDLFKVNEIAEGVQRGILQPIYNNEVTVDCGPIQIATAIDFYAVASGNFDWGNFGMRAGYSFNGAIMLRAIAALASATNNLGAAYSQAGVATNSWATLVSRVSAANGGASVYGLGTLVALNQCIPSTVGLQYGLGTEVSKEGFLDKYLGARLIPLDQFIVPGTVNSSAALGLKDDKVYLVAADQYKPVKVVYEGMSVVVEMDKDQTTDKTYRIWVTMRVGVAAVVGSKFGVITL